MNATIGNISIGYEQKGSDGTQNMSLSTVKVEGKTMINIVTEGWTIDPDKIDEFIKAIKKFKDQATGK